MTNQNPIFTLQLTLEETNTVLAALQELPAKLSNPLSEKIKAQAVPQLDQLKNVTKEVSVQPTAE
jgi:hypothetical protein